MRSANLEKIAKCAAIGLAGCAAVVVAAETVNERKERGSVPVLSASVMSLERPVQSAAESTTPKTSSVLSSVSSVDTVSEPQSSSSVESGERSEPTIISDNSAPPSTSPDLSSEPSVSAEATIQQDTPSSVSETQSDGEALPSWLWDDEAFERYMKEQQSRLSLIPSDPAHYPSFSDMTVSASSSGSSVASSGSSKPASSGASAETPNQSGDPPAQSSEPQEPAVSVPVPNIVNINTAGVEELKTLKGISDEKARAIIEFREIHGDFYNIHDIRQVNGIGDSVFEMIRDYITV